MEHEENLFIPLDKTLEPCYHIRMTSFTDYTDEFPEFVDFPDDSDWDAPEAPPEPPPMPAPSEQEASEMAVYYGQACMWCGEPTNSPQHEVCRDCANPHG